MRMTFACLLGLAALLSTPFASASPQRAATIPPAVLQAWQKASPGVAMSSATQEQEDGKSVFRLEGTRAGRRHVVLFDANGGVVEVGDQVVEKELPAPVASAMHSHPRAIFVNGMKVTRSAQVQYHLTLRGTRKTAMIVKADGTVVSFK